MTNKDAMITFFQNNRSESLNDLCRFYGTDDEDKAIELFSSACEEDEDLLVWLTAEDADTVMEEYQPTRCRFQ